MADRKTFSADQAKDGVFDSQTLNALEKDLNSQQAKRGAGPDVAGGIRQGRDTSDSSKPPLCLHSHNNLPPRYHPNRYPYSPSHHQLPNPPSLIPFTPPTYP